MSEELAEEVLLVCRLVRRDRMIAMSVHRDGCPRAPEDGRTRADGTTWSRTAGTWTEMNEAVEAAEDMGIEPAVWCPTCTGWEVA